MAIDFKIIEERQRRASERFEFMYQELLYAKAAVPCTNRYFRNLQSIFDNIIKILEDTRIIEKETEEKILESGEYDNKKISMIEETYIQIPINLQRIVSSLLQVRQRGLRHYMSSGTPQYILSDIHLGYSLGVSAVESVNYYFHKVLSGFFSKFEKINSPVVSISSEPFYSLFVPDSTGIIGYKYNDSPKTFEEYPQITKKERIANCLNLCYVTLPRWFLTNVRYSATLAHEHYHRLQVLLEFCKDSINKHPKAPQKDDFGDDPSATEEVPEEVQIDVAEEFGKALVILTDLKREIEESYSNYILGIFSEDLDECGEEEKKSIKQTVVLQANELIADVFGLVLAGPAYSYSYFSNIMMFEAESYYSPQSKHPHFTQRLKLQMEFLKAWGFEEDARVIKKELEEVVLRWLREERSGLEELGLEKWIEDNIALFQKLAILIKINVKDNSVIYVGENLSIKETNENIIKIVDNGNLYKLGHYSQSQILNAMWHKMTENKYKKDRELYLRWRKVLAYKALEDDGQ